MKLLILLHVAAMILLYSCREYKGDPVTEFIPGTYIRFSRHEYGTEHDTLVISVQNKSANEYKILRKWKYERVLDGEKIEPEYKRVTTSGIYDDKYKVLRENESGGVFSFDVQRNILFNGTVKYFKL